MNNEIVQVGLNRDVFLRRNNDAAAFMLVTVTVLCSFPKALLHKKKKNL